MFRAKKRICSDISPCALHQKKNGAVSAVLRLFILKESFLNFSVFLRKTIRLPNYGAV